MATNMLSYALFLLLGIRTSSAYKDWCTSRDVFSDVDAQVRAHATRLQLHMTHLLPDSFTV